MRHLTLVGSLVLALLAAGCFGGEEVPNERRFTASDGVVSDGWAYDGQGVAGMSASLDGFTDDAANAGWVNVTFTLDGATYTAVFDRFAQAEGRDFQDGGVAHALDEHGDTGVADASIPRIHALVAAWGSASLMREGQLVTQEPWSAHFMLSADTVRGSDGKITKADGSTPYDPATPADAQRVEGDPQALMFLKHPLGETFQRGALGVGANLSCQGPACTQSAEIAVEEGATMLALNVTYVASGPLPLAVGRGTIRIEDAAGEVAYSGTEQQVVPGGAALVEAVSIPLEGLVGPLTLTLVGDGAFTAQAAGTVTYVDHPFLVITWNEPTLS